MLIKLKRDFISSAVGKVLEVSEADAKTLIERDIAAPAGDDALSPVLTKAMETLAGRLTQNVQQMTEAVLKRCAEAQQQARRKGVPAIFGDGGQGDPKKNFGDWLRHPIIATTGKPQEVMKPADRLKKEYKQSAYQREASCLLLASISQRSTISAKTAKFLERRDHDESSFSEATGVRLRELPDRHIHGCAC